MKCKKHPKYKGILKPRVKCPDCEDIYILKKAKQQALIKGTIAIQNGRIK